MAYALVITYNPVFGEEDIKELSRRMALFEVIETEHSRESDYAISFKSKLKYPKKQTCEMILSALNMPHLYRKAFHIWHSEIIKVD